MHKKRFILSVIVMIMLLIPAAINAQGLFGSDGFFKVNEDNYNNRDMDVNITGGIVNNGIGQSEVPLGTGLIIMLGAATGYVVLKKKEDRL